jgi:rhomboid protease GluP
MKKKVKITFNSPVILIFVLLCFIATLLGTISDGQITQMLFMTYHSKLANPLTYVRFFTHILGHANWEHFVGNASLLLLIGPLLEEKYGSKNILKSILLTAFVTGIVNYIIFLNQGLCGASGVVFAFIIMSSFTSFNNGEIPITFILVAIFFVGQQVYNGIMLNDNISYMAHIIGGIVGALFGFRLNKKEM